MRSSFKIPVKLFQKPLRRPVDEWPFFFQSCHFKLKDFDGAADSFLAGLSQSGKKKRNLDTNLEHEVGLTKRMDLGFEEGYEGV